MRADRATPFSAAATMSSASTAASSMSQEPRVVERCGGDRRAGSTSRPASGAAAACRRAPRRRHRSAAPAGSRLTLLEAALAQRGGVSQLLGISCSAEALPAVPRVLRTQLGVLPPNPFQPKTCHGHVRPPPGGGHLPGTNLPKISNGSIGNFLGLHNNRQQQPTSALLPTIPLQPNTHA